MSLNALAFLRAVLPDVGFYAAWTKLSDKKSYNTCCRSIEELCAFILQEDVLGKTVYHACASFTHEQGIWHERKNKWEFRTQQNAHSARSFWVDLDAKQTGYTDAPACAAALAAFSVAARLPPPWYVASGTGVHGYWPLAKEISRDEWTRFAHALKACAAALGLRVDPARTADIASVLRTPGTHNRKHGAAALVQCGDPVGPYAIEQFHHLLEYISAPRQRQLAVSSAFQPEQATQSLVSAADAPPAYSEPIADQCAHVAALRSTHGNLPEPDWYAVLGVLAWCKDGHAFAHHWSSGFNGYTVVETDERLTRARTLTGATTCAKFESLDVAKCAACVFRGKIKSPISLGISSTPPRGSTFASQPSTSSLNQTLPASSFTPTLQSEQSDWQLPPLPLHYEWGAQSQLVFKAESRDEIIDVVVSQYPIYLDSVQTGELAKEKFSYGFKQYLPHVGWIDIHIGAAELTGHAGISKLFGGGAVISEPKYFMKYVEHAVNSYHAQWKLRMRYEQFGWKDDGHAFLYGDSLYRADTVEPAVGTDEIKTRAQWLAPAEGGSLDQWSNAANALFQLGCEAQSFALLCSFAAPLTPFHAENEGGSIVSLVSNDTGTGKTTALAGVESVWSAHKGLSLTSIDTTVSKGLTLGVLGNLPCIYDELWDRDPQVIREFVMMFTNGRDKMRGTREGEIKHTAARWQTILVSAANLSLVETLARSSAVDAPGMRVIEFHLTKNRTMEHWKGDKLKKALWANCGYAGDVYLRYLMQPDVLAWARAALDTWTEEIWHKTKLDRKYRFWVRTLGSVSVASALVTKLGILSFQPSRVVEWAIDKLVRQSTESLISGRGAACTDALAEYLTEHVQNTLVVHDKFQPGKGYVQALLKPQRPLYVRYELKPGRILLNESAFRKWMLDKGVNYREALEELVEQKVVLKGRVYATLSAGTELPGGQTPCVEVNALHPLLSGVLTEVASLQAVRQDNNPFVASR